MTPSEQSDTRAGLVDWPDGTDWKCDECGRVIPDSEDLDHDCGGTLQRVNRAYFWDGNRTDVVVEHAGPPLDDEDFWDDEIEEEDSRS